MATVAPSSSSSAARVRLKLCPGAGVVSIEPTNARPFATVPAPVPTGIRILLTAARPNRANIRGCSRSRATKKRPCQPVARAMPVPIELPIGLGPTRTTSVANSAARVVRSVAKKRTGRRRGPWRRPSCRRAQTWRCCGLELQRSRRRHTVETQAPRSEVRVYAGAPAPSNAGRGAGPRPRAGGGAH